MRREHGKIPRESLSGSEARLRDLCAAAYQPVEPSDALHRRVAETAARSVTGKMLTARARQYPIVWGVAAVASVLLVAHFRVNKASNRGDAGFGPATEVAAGKAQSPPARAENSVPEGGVLRPSGEVKYVRAVRSPRFQPPGTRLDDAVSTIGSPALLPHSGTGDRPHLIRSDQRPDASIPPQTPPSDDFVTIPPPRLVDSSGNQIATALRQHERETAIVDARLAREVSLSRKAIALSDLCDQMRSDTGIRLAAGASVADEKVTIFCAKRPLREVMRQLSRPFGYIWLRSGKEGDYRYELVQDLKSQLMEEELRNRDRNAALIALHEEMERYRPYLHLSPDEALAASRTATPVEKPLLERLGGNRWGAIQMYFRLTPDDIAALRAGRALGFRQDAESGQQPLPPDVARGSLQTWRDVRLRDDPENPERPRLGNAENLPDGVPPIAYPRARARVTLRLGHSELGQYTMEGGTGVHIGTMGTNSNGELASGLSPSVRNPENASRNSRWSREPALRARITLALKPSCRSAHAAGADPSPTPDAKATSADLLEAIHRASGMPIVADYFTRLHSVAQVSAQSATLFDALNRLSDTMRMHWNREEKSNWLQFRSVSYYDDRMKEVPNRLLTRWSAARGQQGLLTLDNLCEIVQLTEVQLNSETMAEGARHCFNLLEWDLPRFSFRQHLRYLAGLTPEQRRTTTSAAGLPFGQLSLAQQQQLMAHLGNRVSSLDALSRMTIRVVYLQPGEFQWVQPGMSEFRGPNRAWPANFFGLPTVRDRSREGVLQAARRIEPNVDPAQIRPTELWLAVMYRTVDPRTGEPNEHGFAGTARGGRVNW